MGEVVDLGVARRRRARRRRAIAVRAAMHPALRWVTGGDERAHRRLGRRGVATACGRAGPLLLAPPGAPLCPACYPAALPAAAE